MKVKPTKTYILELSQDELLTLMNALGSTSYGGRIDAGMEEEQSEFIQKFWDELSDSVDLS